MKKASTKTTTKAPAKSTAKTASKSTDKKVPAKKASAKKAAAKKTITKTVPVQKTQATVFSKNDKLNKLERALAEKQISREEYELWKEVYAKEVPFDKYAVEENYRPRKTKRRRAY